MCSLYQQAVEEDMYEDTQDADDEVEEVVQELHIHDHSLIAPRERPPVSHKTHQEDHFIAHLPQTHTKKRERWAKSDRISFK